MTSYPLTEDLIAKIEKEAKLIADNDIDYTTLYNEVRKLCILMYASSAQINEKNTIKLCSGLIGLQQLNQNKK